MAKDDSDPAFPQFMGMATNPEGMTLRDYFAGQALVGMATFFLKANGTVEEIAKANAEVAYKMADAMLAERNKE